MNNIWLKFCLKSLYMCLFVCLFYFSPQTSHKNCTAHQCKTLHWLKGEFHVQLPKKKKAKNKKQKKKKAELVVREKKGFLSLLICFHASFYSRFSNIISVINSVCPIFVALMLWGGFTWIVQFASDKKKASAEWTNSHLKSNCCQSAPWTKW